MSKLKLSRVTEFLVDLDRERERVKNASYDVSERHALNTVLDLLENGKYAEAQYHYYQWPRRGALYWCSLLQKQVKAEESWREYLSEAVTTLLENLGTYNWSVEKIEGENHG